VKESPVLAEKKGRLPDGKDGTSCRPFRTGLRLALRATGWVLIGVVRLYQLLLSPVLGRHCRFHPTCSTYFIESVRKYGATRGGWRGLLRICRCHPWHPGGYDPP